MIRQEPSSAEHDLRDIFRDGAELYSRNAVLLLTIAAVIVPVDLVVWITTESPLYEVVTTTQLLVELLAIGAMIAAVGDIAAGGQPNLSQAFSRALERFWPLLRTSVLLILVMLPAAGLLFVGFWLAMDENTSTSTAVAPSLLAAGAVVAVPTVYLIVRWLFALQAVVLDGTGTFDSLRLSSTAVGGNWRQPFAMAVLVAITWYTPGWLARYAFGWAPDPLWYVFAILLSVTLLPFSLAATTLLYLSRRGRHETPQIIARART